MANPHFNVSILSRSSGGIAIKKSAYISKERMKDETREKTFNYSKKSDEVAFREMFLPEYVPADFQNPEKLWASIERSSHGPKAQLARYGSAALPKELNRQQQIELVRDFFGELQKDGMCCQVALHDSNGKNPHVDFMMTMRRWDEKKGTWASKKTSVYARDSEGHLIPNKKDKNGKMTYKKSTINNAWDDKSCVQKWRDLWEKKTNEALKKAGKTERVSLKSLSKRRAEALRKGDFEEAEKLNRVPDEHYGPRAGKGKSEPAKRRNTEREEGPKLTRKELIKNKKREAFFRKKAAEKSQEAQRKKFAKRYGIEPNPKEIGYIKSCLMKGAEVRVGELPKKWSELEAREHLEISEVLKKCGIKKPEAKKAVKKQCLFMYDKLHHEWAFTRDESIKSQVEAAKGVASGASKVAGKAGKTAIAIIGSILKLPGKIPGVKKIPGIGLPGQLAEINKVSKSLQIKDIKNGKPPKGAKPKSGIKEKYENLKNAKNGLKSAGQEFTPQPPPKKDGVLGVLKEALEETNGKLNPNDLSKRGGSEFSSVWMSEMQREQWKIDHGISIEDEWEVQGMTKWRKIRG